MLVLGSSSTYSQHINHSGQDSLKFSFELHYFGPDLRLAQTKTVIPIQSVQNADCRLGTKCRLRIQTVFSFDTWWHVILQLTERHAIAFPQSSFYDYLHYCGIFLARFSITDVLYIISSIPRVFSLCGRVGWCVRNVFTEFTNLKAHFQP